MKLRQLAAFLFALTIFILPQPAQAQSKYYAPPLSFSNAELTRRDFSGQMLRSAEFSNANMDLTNFTNADLSGAILAETILLRSTFDGVDITGADFTDAIMDGSQVKELCTKASGINSQTVISTRDSLGCR